MTSYSPYRGERYEDFPWLEAFCASVAQAHPGWARLDTYGQSREGRPLLILTLHLGEGDPREHSAFWLDGGTHASEWAGIMATCFAVSRWAERLAEGDAALEAFFRRHTIYVAPCISPDGFQHLMEGKPFLRSTKRPPPEGLRRVGHEPRDLDGDGEVLWMRWPHPAGPWVVDEACPLAMRPRGLEDPPEAAFFCCPEGVFLEYDGTSWRDAPALHGLDLNRNFPVSWEPQSQFGMDGGAFPLSEPESRAVTDALIARPNVCAAQTNHTYTGGILVAPYRRDSPLSIWDRETLYRLAAESVKGTGYRTFKVHPDFEYVEGRAIPGVWADFLVTNRGIPAYTLELWDPFAHCGVEMKDPARNFFRPDVDVIGQCLRHFAQDPESHRPWRSFDHPQLGPVEIGGLRSTYTFRNPPPRLLAAECARAFTVADRLRRALPDPVLSHTLEAEGDLTRLTLVVENHGYLSTAGLGRAAEAALTTAPQLKVEAQGGLRVLTAGADEPLPHLPGWGDAPSTFRRHPLFPVLGSESPRLQRVIHLTGAGELRVTYAHPRSGTRSLTLPIP